MFQSKRKKLFQHKNKINQKLASTSCGVRHCLCVVPLAALVGASPSPVSAVTGRRLGVTRGVTALFPALSRFGRQAIPLVTARRRSPVFSPRLGGGGRTRQLSSRRDCGGGDVAAR